MARRNGSKCLVDGAHIYSHGYFFSFIVRHLMWKEIFLKKMRFKVKHVIFGGSAEKAVIWKYVIFEIAVSWLASEPQWPMNPNWDTLFIWRCGPSFSWGNALSSTCIVNTWLHSNYGSYLWASHLLYVSFYTSTCKVRTTKLFWLCYSLTSLRLKFLVHVPATANRNSSFSCFPGRLATCGASTAQSTACRGSLHTSWTQTVNPDSPHYARFDRDCG